MLRTNRKTRTSNEPHATRVRLIEATAHTIDEQGIDAVDIDEIVTAAGVTKGALYHHFGSVNGLLVAAVVSLYAANVDENIRAFESILVDCHDVEGVRQRLAAITRATQDPHRRSVRLHRARVLSQTVAEPDLASQIDAEQRRLTDAIAATVAQAQARRWIRPDLDPRALAVFVQSYTLGRVIDDVTTEHMSDSAWIALIDQVIDGFLLIDRHQSADS
jgi:AcrR family transcriptional regulator